MNDFDRYLSVVFKLRNRYKNSDGTLEVSKGGVYSKYAILEDMAAVKYLGCNPKKMRCDGLFIRETK